MPLPVFRGKPAHRGAGLYLAVAFVSGTIACCVGCGAGKQADPNRATISGTVTYDGKPLPAGAITFASATGNLAATISINEDGSYSTDRAPLGPNEVTIDTASIKYGNPGKYVAIPAKYADPTQSGFTVEVKSGDNANVNFDLKP